MITKSHAAALFLDVSLKQDKLTVSLSKEDTPFYQSEEISFNLKEIESLCFEIRLLLNKSNTAGRLSYGLLEELKKTCLLLYDCLLSARVKGRLKNSECENLIIRMDEQLVFIPWELLYNGEDFICLAFNVGRRVITNQPLADQAQRQSQYPLKMLILSAPCTDLPAAQTELRCIRDQLDCNREVLAVSAKTGAITVDYVMRNIRDYDFIHFAGHMDHEENQPSLDGWRLSDGRFSAREIQKMQGGSPFPLFIFLNSCRSADISSESVKDGYEQKCYGLVHAFLTAGIKHYIGTLWEIPDSVGFVVAAEFYGRIKEGVSIGEALRQARRKVMKEFGEGNIVWAGYVLYGDPRYSPFPRGLESSSKVFLLKRITRKFSFTVIVGLLGTLLIAGFIVFGWRGGKSYPSKSLNRKTLSAKISSVQADRQVREIRLAQIMVPAPSDSQSVAVLKQQFGRAQKTNNVLLMAQTSYALANELKETRLEMSDSFAHNENSDTPKPAMADTYSVLLDLYGTALSNADKIQDHRLAARALFGAAQVNHWRGENHTAITDYEKAVEYFAMIKTLQKSDYVSLLVAYMELAQLYSLDNLDFNQAEETLSKILPIAMILKNYDDRWLEDKAMLLLQYDHFLEKMAESKYANSHFALQVKTVREKLKDL